MRTMIRLFMGLYTLVFLVYVFSPSALDHLRNRPAEWLMVVFLGTIGWGLWYAFLITVQEFWDYNWTYNLRRELLSFGQMPTTR